MRPARSPRAACSTRPAASPSPTCCATSAKAPISTPPSCTASSGRSSISSSYTDSVSGVDRLIGEIDAAVRLGDPAAITEQVKRSLQDAIRTGRVGLPQRFHVVRPEGYARRLLYRSDDLGYVAVVMTWGPGQRTPLHDHAGIWCVEGVVQGRMDVTQYDLVEDAGGGPRLASRGSVRPP